MYAGLIYPYNPIWKIQMRRLLAMFILVLFISACAPKVPSASVQMPEIDESGLPGFLNADGTRPLTFPEDFGAHEEYRTEWWYYTGNLQTPEGRPFGFELTIFRVGLLPLTAELPADSKWYGRSIYFAHFALSDISNDQFHAFERYARPGPGLAGAQAAPFRAWLEDWDITEQSPGLYRLQAGQEGIQLDLTLTDEMGVVLHGDNGFSRGGAGPSNASYYFSQPRLRAEGTVQVEGMAYPVEGLAWMDHDFSSTMLDKNQVGWDWFSLQLENGPILMIFQLREQSSRASEFSSGTYKEADGSSQPFLNDNFEITVLDTWRSPHTSAIYPAGWEVRVHEPACLLQVQPLMADQELHFPAVTYWEGAVRFEGTCAGEDVQGKGYVELTGYAGNLPLR